MATDPIANETFATDEDTVLTGAVTLPADDGSGTVWTVTAINGVPVVFGEPVALPSGALLTFDADGTFTYDPNGAYDWLDAGGIIEFSDSFDWTVSDGAGNTDTATARIVIDGLNDTPVAADDAFATDELTALAGNVLADNGNGADGDVDISNGVHVTAVDGDAAAVGTTITLASGALLTLAADGSFDYDPNGAFGDLDDGETVFDSFTYTLTDAHGASDTATVEIAVNGISQLPTPVFSIDAPLVFDGGRDDFLDAGHPDALDAAAGTVMMSFNADDLCGKQYLFAMDEPGAGDGLAAWLQGATLFVGDPTGGGSDALRVDGIELRAGTDYQLAVSFGEAGREVWLDGHLVAGDTAGTGGFAGIDGDLLIGAVDRDGDGWARQAFDGTVDGFDFYDSRLSGDDIGALIGGVGELPGGGATLLAADTFGAGDGDGADRLARSLFDDDRAFPFGDFGGELGDDGHGFGRDFGHGARGGRDGRDDDGGDGGSGFGPAVAEAFNRAIAELGGHAGDHGGPGGGPGVGPGRGHAPDWNEHGQHDDFSFA